MRDKQLLQDIKEYAELSIKLKALFEKINRHPFFSDLRWWSCCDVYEKCKIIDGILYDKDNNKLSENYDFVDEDILYFTNQYSGYSEDDYYGCMYARVDDDENTFVKILYEG